LQAVHKAAFLTRPTPAHRDAPFRGQGPSERRAEAYPFSPARSELSEQFFLAWYVEGLNDVRTTPGLRNVLPCRDWAGETGDFFNSLLDRAYYVVCPI